MPVLPAAPARLSMMSGWPSDICSDVARMRAMMSVGPPGANGTMRVIGRSGQAARAGAVIAEVNRIIRAVVSAKSPILSLPARCEGIEEAALRSMKFRSIALFMTIFDPAKLPRCRDLHYLAAAKPQYRSAPVAEAQRTEAVAWPRWR